MIDYYLTSASVCELFKAGAIDTWERIRFSRTIPNLKIHETTITQNIIYEFKLIQQSLSIRGLRIQESRNEKANGADIELVVIAGGRAIRFVIQAKIIYHTSKKKHGDGDYRHMQHPPKEPSGQVERLLNYANRKRAIPLYLMYNYVNNDLPVYLDMRLFGCTVISAKFLKDNKAFGTGNLRKNITFSELHTFPSTAVKPAIPWHELLCETWAKDLSGILAKLGLPPSTAIDELNIKELLEDDNFIEITSERSLTRAQQLKAKQNFDQQFEGLPDFNPKFRILVDPNGELNNSFFKTI